MAGYGGWSMPTDSWSDDIAGARAAQALIAASGYANQFDTAGINAIGSALGGQGVAAMIKAMQDRDAAKQMEALKQAVAMRNATIQAQYNQGMLANQAALGQGQLNLQREQLPLKLQAELEKQRIANQGPLGVQQMKGEQTLQQLPLTAQVQAGLEQQKALAAMELQNARQAGELPIQELKNRGQVAAMMAAHGAMKPDANMYAQLQVEAQKLKIPEPQRADYVTRRYKEIQQLNSGDSSQLAQLLGIDPSTLTGGPPQASRSMSSSMAALRGNQSPQSTGNPTLDMRLNAMPHPAAPVQDYVYNLLDLLRGQASSQIPDYSAMSMPGTAATANMWRYNR